MGRFDSVSDEELELELEKRKRKDSRPPEPVEQPDWNEFSCAVVKMVDGWADEDPPREGDDLEHRVYEAAIETIYGKGFWDWYNKRVQ